MPRRTAACLFLLSSYLLAQAPTGRVTPPEILNLKRVPTEKQIPGDGRHRSPLFVQMPQGPLHAYSLRTVQGVTEEVIQTSTDDGRTWSTPVTAFKLPAGFGDVGAPKLLLDSRGQIHFFMPVNPGRTTGDYSQQQWNLWYVRSTDAPFHWAAPKEIWKGYVGSLQSAIQLRSGRIVLPFCFLTQRSWSNRGSGPDAFTYTGKFSSTVLYSDDGGDRWTQSTELKTPTPDITTILGAIEPVVLEPKDGRVWMLIRRQMGRFYESFSADGAEWSRPRPTEIISSDSPAGLIRLKDGRILLIWNNCLRFPYAYGGRHVLHAAVSENEGRTWRGYREVLRDASRDRPPLPNGDFGVSYSLPAPCSTMARSSSASVITVTFPLYFWIRAGCMKRNRETTSQQGWMSGPPSAAMALRLCRTRKDQAHACSACVSLRQTGRRLQFGTSPPVIEDDCACGCC